ncbi:MAG: hypothetical protein AAGA09_08670 [Pseudomonadota bacterium]
MLHPREIRKKSAERRILVAAGVFLAASLSFGPASAAEPLFDLWTLASEDRAIVAVTGHKNRKVVSVASGAEPASLDILTPKAASAAMKALRERIAGHSLERVLTDRPASTKKRFKAVERNVIAENDAMGSGHELSAADQKAAAHAPETLQDKAASHHVSPKPAAPGVPKNTIDGAKAATTIFQTADDGPPAKITRISGASAAEARAFVTAAEGLSDEERQLMKAALGL